MSELVGVVIRKNGMVPFDDTVSEADRARTLAWLTDQGHTFKAVPNSRHVMIEGWKPKNAGP